MLFYAINATMAPRASEEDLRAMVRTLLASRFQLRAHRESKDFAGYELAVDKKRLKIQEFKASDQRPPLPEWFRGKGDEFAKACEGRGVISREGEMNALMGRGISMSQLAGILGEYCQILSKTIPACRETIISASCLQGKERPRSLVRILPWLFTSNSD